MFCQTTEAQCHARAAGTRRNFATIQDRYTPSAAIPEKRFIDQLASTAVRPPPAPLHESRPDWQTRCETQHGKCRLCRRCCSTACRGRSFADPLRQALADRSEPAPDAAARRRSPCQTARIQSSCGNETTATTHTANHPAQTPASDLQTSDGPARSAVQHRQASVHRRGTPDCNRRRNSPLPATSIKASANLFSRCSDVRFNRFGRPDLVPEGPSGRSTKPSPNSNAKIPTSRTRFARTVIAAPS